MRSKLIRTIMAALMVTVLASGLSMPAGAASAEPPEADVSASISEPGVTPQADVIVIYTRTHNGVKQYRRWNRTRNRWVDPDWIDC